MQAAWLVGLGGALGAIARYYVTLGVAQRLGTGWPYGTLFVNVTGSLLIGMLGSVAFERTGWLAPELRLLFGLGFCGAYTTFSAFGLETLTMLRAGSYVEAAIYIGLSNVLGLAAVFAGVLVGRALAA